MNSRRTFYAAAALAATGAVALGVARLAPRQPEPPDAPAASPSAPLPDPVERPPPSASGSGEVGKAPAPPAPPAPAGATPPGCEDLGPAAPGAPAIALDEHAGPGRLPGVDASNPAPWKTIRQTGFAFAFAAVTHGIAKNESFPENWAMMKRCGLPRGGYHFLTHKSDGAAQARAYLEHVGDDPGELPPIVDVEKPPGCHGDCCDLSCSQWTTLARAWIDEVTRRAGRQPIVYTVEPFWNQCLCGTKKLRDHPLWLAGWPKFDFPEELHFGGWSHWTFYQHAGNARIGGTVVDLNLFRGTAEDLERFIRAGRAP